MKFNFKKIATVLGSAVLVGSTIGFAAAANYPAPFNQEASAIVVGSAAQSLDVVAAANIASNLAAANTVSAATGTTATTTGGDSYKLEKTSQKFWLGKYVGNVSQSTIDDDQLPNLLKEGTYTDDDNEEFDYKQNIVINPDMQLKMFNDNDYKKDTPTIGIKLNNNDFILNYTLDFTEKPTFDKIATTDLPIMDKMYYVLSVNSDNDTLTLLDSAADAVVKEGETATVKVGDKDYTVSIATLSGSASTPKVKLTANGETTTELAEGQTRRLADGSYVGIKDISMRDVAGTVASVEFSIGKGKMVVENNAKVQINDEEVRNVYGYIVNDTVKLDNLVLKWTANDDTFITENTSVTMPGFGVAKLSFGGMTFPSEETFSVEAGGNDNAILSNFPLKNGAVDIPLVGKQAGNTNYTFIGTDDDELVVTAPSTTLTFDASTGNNDYFIASWTDGDAAESYLVRPTGFNDPSTGDDTVDFEFNDGSGWTKKYDNVEQGEEISFGNVELTVSALNSTVDVETVTLTDATSGEVSFNTLYTKGGLKVTMPWINTSAVSMLNATNYTSATACANATSQGKFAAVSAATGELGYNHTLSYTAAGSATTIQCTYFLQDSYALLFQEEDKEGNIGAGDTFNVTIGNNGASNYYTTVTTFSAGNSSTREKSATDVYETWVYSALATKVVEDDSGDQDDITITYHGGESFGNVFLLAPSATVTPGTPGTPSGVGSVTVFDNEVDSVKAKNLIVVGGSCVNTVAASLLGSTTPLCGADFTTKTGVGNGQFLVKVFDNPYTTGKIAMLVAGYEAADTQKAATYLTTNTVNSAVGTVVKKTSATYADVA